MDSGAQSLPQIAGFYYRTGRDLEVLFGHGLQMVIGYLLLVTCLTRSNMIKSINE
jgi:hypothetical protein